VKQRWGYTEVKALREAKKKGLKRDMITSDTQVEKIMEYYPQAVSYFIQNGVSPISCAGAFPTTLGKLLAIKKVEDTDGFIKGLNDFIDKNQE
jgi:Domain of unknown function (DUF1858).